MTGLIHFAAPDVSTNDNLLEELDAQPLAGISDRIDALPAKGVAARKAIAEILKPEAKVAKVSLPAATLESESDVDNFITALRTKLMGHIDAGETVVI